MIEEFPRRRQQTGWSCLPTAVLCVLEYLGWRDVGMDQVADWCHVRPGGGCVWDLSLGGLRDALQGEFDVDDLEGDWDGIREAVENDAPVIVTIANPNPMVELVGVHAVVFIRIEATEGDGEQGMYMDPATGTYERKSLAEFQQWWDTPGQQAFVIRP